MREHESPLVRLARITRVDAYRRRGTTGKSEHVDSYLRKVLDSYGFGADAATKKAAFVSQYDKLKAEKGQSAAETMAAVRAKAQAPARAKVARVPREQGSLFDDDEPEVKAPEPPKRFDPTPEPKKPAAKRVAKKGPETTAQRLKRINDELDAKENAARATKAGLDSRWTKTRDWTPTWAGKVKDLKPGDTVYTLGSGEPNNPAGFSKPINGKFADFGKRQRTVAKVEKSGRGFRVEFTDGTSAEGTPAKEVFAVPPEAVEPAKAPETNDGGLTERNRNPDTGGMETNTPEPSKAPETPTTDPRDPSSPDFKPILPGVAWIMSQFSTDKFTTEKDIARALKKQHAMWQPAVLRRQASLGYLEVDDTNKGFKLTPMGKAALEKSPKAEDYQPTKRETPEGWPEMTYKSDGQQTRVYADGDYIGRVVRKMGRNASARGGVEKLYHEVRVDGKQLSFDSRKEAVEALLGARQAKTTDDTEAPEAPATKKPGDRVRGTADIGDTVKYEDIANQNSEPVTVISTPDQNKDPEYGWSKGYGLSDGHFSDLRQHGWTFTEAPTPKAPEDKGKASREAAITRAREARKASGSKEEYGFGFNLPRKINDTEPRIRPSGGSGLPSFPGERRKTSAPSQPMGRMGAKDAINPVKAGVPTGPVDPANAEVDKWGSTPMPRANQAEMTPWLNDAPVGTVIKDKQMAQSYIKTEKGWITGGKDGTLADGFDAKKIPKDVFHKPKWLASSVGKNPSNYSHNLKAKEAAAEPEVAAPEYENRDGAVVQRAAKDSTKGKSDRARADLTMAYMNAQRTVDAKLGYRNPNALEINLGGLQRVIEEASEDADVLSIIEAAFSGRLRGEVLKSMKAQGYKFPKTNTELSNSDEYSDDVLELSAEDSHEVDRYLNMNR